MLKHEKLVNPENTLKPENMVKHENTVKHEKMVKHSYPVNRITRWPMPFSAAILFIAATLGGCAGMSLPGKGMTERLELNGYSFMPPPEPEWFIADRTPDRIALARLGWVEGQTFLAEGSLLNLDELRNPSQLARYVKEMHDRDLPRPRFRIQEHDVTDLRIAGAQCALSHIVAEDRDPETGSNVVTAMLVETVGTVCIHPGDARTGVSLSYSHRSFPEDRDRGFEAYATPLLQTQQFDDLHKPRND